ncbi:MAG TPA: hypothetical protein VG317_09405 [Pseudonocardiaceae bacterium]|nr:hypothetical protein [Pseudonocardiaceae bacterium]
MDETTDNSVNGPVNGLIVQAGRIDNLQVVANEPSRPATVPRHIQPPPAVFVNRMPVHRAMSREHRECQDAGRATTLALHGPPGIGVAAAVRKWYWDNKERFPDGGIRIPLGDRRQGTSLALLAGFNLALVDLDVPYAELPTSLAAAEARFHTVTDGKRLLLWLDGVSQIGQVQPFLLSSPGSVVIVTSRRPLVGLHSMGFRSWSVDPLDTAFSQRLLRAHLRWEDGSLDGARESAVVTNCAGFPLLIGQIAESLSNAKPRRAQRLLSKFCEQGTRGLPRDAQQIVNERFDLAYQEMSEPQRRTYRLMALHPGAEFSLAAAAALLGMADGEAADELDELSQAGLLTEVRAERYRFHEAVRTHAVGRAVKDEDPASTLAAIERVVTWYLRDTVGYDRVLSERWRVGPLFAVIPANRQGADPRQNAFTCLETERPNLVEAVALAERHGLDDLCWQLCEALWGLLHQHRHYDAWIDTHQLGLGAALRTGNDLAVLRLSSQLGSAQLAVGELTLAADSFAESLAAARRLGDEDWIQRARGIQSALEWLGKVEARRGNTAAAVDYWNQSWDAVSAAHQDDQQRMYALLQLHRGRLFLAQQRFAAAQEELVEAGKFFGGTKERDNTERDNKAKVAWARSQAQRGLGQLAAAIEAAGEALRHFDADGSLGSQADVLLLLADLHAEQSDTEAEQGCLRQALAIFVRLGSPKAAEIAARLSDSD